MTDIIETNDPEKVALDATANPLRADDQHPGDGHSGPSDATFIKVFFALAAITALEVALSYADVGVIFLPALLILMIIKFFTVVLVFMHIKYDNKLFGRLFYIGLFMALAVYMATLSTFHFFAG